MEAEIGLFRFPVEVRIIAFANFGHPSRNWSTSELDFSFALHASRELCLYVLTPNSEKMYSGLESQVDKNRWFERDSLQRSLDYLSETKKSFEKYPSLGKEFYPFLDFLLMDHIVGADEQSKKTYFA